MNVKPAYYTHTIQKKYLLRRSCCHRGMFQDPIKLEYIKEKLLRTWSPEQIANTPCELDMCLPLFYHCKNQLVAMICLLLVFSFLVMYDIFFFYNSVFQQIINYEFSGCRIERTFII